MRSIGSALLYGFRHFLPFYVNGTGQTTIASGVVGGEVRLTDRLRPTWG